MEFFSRKPGNEGRGFRVILITILSYAIGMTVISLSYYDIGQIMFVENDFYSSYAPAAQKILQKDFSSVSRHYEYQGIGYPLLLAFLTSITGDYFLSGKIISLISSTISLILVFAIFSRISYPLLGAFTTIGLMATRPFILYSYTVGTDMVFVALSLLSFYLLTVSTHKTRHLITSGLLAGYGFLTRYNQIFFLPAIFFYLIIKKSTQNSTWRIKKALLFLSGYLMVVVPWFIFLYQMTGHSFYNLHYRNLAYDFIYQGQVDKDYFWEHLSESYKSVWQVIQFDPIGFLFKFTGHLLSHLPSQLKEAFPGYIIWFVALGATLVLTYLIQILLNVRRGYKSETDPGPRHFQVIPVLSKLREKGKGLGKLKSPEPLHMETFLFFLLIAGSFYFFSGLIHYEERYFLLLLPYYLFFCFFPLGYFNHEIFKKKFWTMKLHKLIPVLIGASLLGPMAFTSYQANLRWLESLPREFLFFRDFLGFLPSGNEKLMAKTAHLPFLARKTFQHLPLVNSIEEFKDYLKRNDTDLVYISRWEAEKRPVFSHLLSAFIPQGALIPLVKWQDKGRTSILYGTVYSETDSPPLFPRIFLTMKGWNKGGLIPSGIQNFWGSYEVNGLLKAETSGKYEIGLVGDRFLFLIDGKRFLFSKPRRTDNFYRNTRYLDKGWHSFELSFELRLYNFFLSGPFWQTPAGKKEPIPQEYFKINNFRKLD